LMKKLLDAGFLEDWKFNQTDAAVFPKDQS
jgi:hypothetical protein